MAKQMKLSKGKVRVMSALAGYPNMNTLAKALAEREEPHRIGKTTFYESLDSYNFKSKTVNVLAELLGCSPVQLLSFDYSMEAES